MIKQLILVAASVSLLACASNNVEPTNYQSEAKPRPVDLSYRGKAAVFPEQINGAPAFSSLADSTGQSEAGKAVRYFLRNEPNQTNASITLYLLTRLSNGDTVAAYTEKEVMRWADTIGAEGKSYRVEPPEEIYSSELGGVEFYFGETIQNHSTAHDLYMAEFNGRLVQIRLVGPATRTDRIARREIVKQIADHLSAS